MNNEPREYIHKIIDNLKSQVNEYNDVLQYVISMEDRLNFVCSQNGAYKERCIELAKALEDMVIEHCTHIDHLDHKNNKANQAAFKALGIKNGITISALEKLLERKLK